MGSLLITNIRQLVNTRKGDHLLRGTVLSELPTIENAYLMIDNNIIVEMGEMKDLKSTTKGKSESKQKESSQIDATGKFVFPCWCDSHTHLVFAGSREHEFIDKIRGLSYSEIAAKGGGILHSAKRLNETTEDELFNHAWKRLEEVSALGTGAIEIKSGYGLTVDGELKILRVIKKLKNKSNLQIRSTFLGAHTYPLEFKDDHKGYIDLVINKMLPEIAKEKLADYIDVFCEKGFFSPEETETICRAGMVYGLKPRLHVNQLNSIGGIQAGIKLGAVSLDHLETLTDEEIKLLSEKFKGTCTLLPTAAFFLRMPFQPARQLIDAGSAIALASDYNPGSSPSGNMNLVISMGCIGMKMLPEEAINAATINGACSMEMQSEVGSIFPGKKANLIFTKTIPSLPYLPYSFGSNLIDRVMINGKWV